MRPLRDLCRSVVAPLALAQAAWDEMRSLSPMHRGMSYERLEKLGGIQWPCADENDPGSPFLHGRLWDEPVRGPRAPFQVVSFEPPVDALDALSPSNPPTQPSAAAKAVGT